MEFDPRLDVAKILREQAERLEATASNQTGEDNSKPNVEGIMTNIRTLSPEDFFRLFGMITKFSERYHYPTFSPPDYISTKEAAKLRGVSTTRIKELAEGGLLGGSVNIDGRWHIHRGSLENHTFPGRGRQSPK